MTGFDISCEDAKHEDPIIKNRKERKTYLFTPDYFSALTTKDIVRKLVKRHKKNHDQQHE